MGKNSLSYIRFLNCLDTLDRMNPGKTLDSIEEQLLNNVMKAWDCQATLLVGDLLALHDLGSQATLHGRIKNLSVMGYIKLNIDKHDSRKKYITPSKMAIAYYEKLSQQIEKSLNSSSR